MMQYSTCALVKGHRSETTISPCICCMQNKSDSSYLKPTGPLNIPTHSGAPLIAILSWFDGSVGITSSCSLLAFPLLVSLALSRLCCLCFAVSQTHNCARLVIVATQVLKTAVRISKSTKVKYWKWLY